MQQINYMVIFAVLVILYLTFEKKAYEHFTTFSPPELLKKDVNYALTAREVARSSGPLFISDALVNNPSEEAPPEERWETIDGPVNLSRSQYIPMMAPR